MNNKKIKKYFKILFVPISMLICLSIFLINSYAQAGYEVNENGNIESLNLLDISNYYSERVSVSINDNEISINVNNESWAYIEYQIVANIRYTISFDSVGSGKVVFSDNGNTLYNIDFTTGHFSRSFTSDNTYLRFYVSWVSNDSRTTILSDIMLNEGNNELDYFPYGVYYTTPQDSNFMQFLIGQNYFSGGRAMIYQTNTTSPYWDRQIYPTNRTCAFTIGNTRIGNYIQGNTLYLGTLSYDLINGLKDVQDYVYSRNTTITLKPTYSFATSSFEYLNLPCKYVNLDVYCPNGVFEVSCYVGNGSELITDDNERIFFQQNGDYVHISFDDDDNRWLYEIEIVLNHSNDTFVTPSDIYCNTDSTLQWDLYQIGYDDGFRSAEGTITYLNSQINNLNSQIDNLNNSINILREQNAQLRESLNNNFGFDDVFFALADTPFKTASNMLGFELFGVNLFNALVGFITVLACIWLLKKFL